MLRVAHRILETHGSPASATLDESRKAEATDRLGATITLCEDLRPHELSLRVITADTEMTIYFSPRPGALARDMHPEGIDNIRKYLERMEAALPQN